MNAKRQWLAAWYRTGQYLDNSTRGPVIQPVMSQYFIILQTMCAAHDVASCPHLIALVLY